MGRYDPKPLTGAEFYEFKKIREPNSITPSEEENYQNGRWTNYPELILNPGFRQQHTLTLSGATESINYYISGSLLNVDGIAMNDMFDRYTLRNNIEIKITKWLTYGGNTQLAFSDRSGIVPSWRHVWAANPLTVPYDEKGNLIIYHWPEQPDNTNPMDWKEVQNSDITYKVISNNFLNAAIPFIDGLSYRLNTGLIYASDKEEIYWPKTTKRGFEQGGSAFASNQNSFRWIIENIVGYSKSFENHKFSATAIYSAQEDIWENRSLSANGFPNDVLTSYQFNLAAKISPSDDYHREALVSQMLRINYNYGNRYLATLTGRRDGFSGFGQNNKYGFFPSLALGWVVSEESWFTNRLSVSDLKLRASYGKSGNQAVGPYETFSRLVEDSYVTGSISAPGYLPSKLGTPYLGWESSNSLNVGIDFTFLRNRIQGSFDLYSTKTNDLLLNRSISSVHGISQITQNVGKTKNQGIEILINSNNIITSEIRWSSNFNFSYNHNEILSLYGTKVDDIGNKWFIGQPIRVVFMNEFGGVFQPGDDIQNSAQPDAQPGYAKVVDQNRDGKIDEDDRIIHGQLDPKISWGLNNTISYKNFSFYFLMYGLHGHVDANDLLVDYVWGGVRLNTTRKDWWTPENPTNKYYKNEVGANSYSTRIVEKKGFVRIKDVSLSFTLPSDLLSRLKLINAKIYLTARNLGVFTNWTGWDPELEWAGDNPPVPRQPMQREYLIGFTVDF
jgi:TonB-linked SusC/RagA family outer membrane protein